MSDRRLYWQNRLSNREMRIQWWKDLEELGLLADVRATDKNGTTDEKGTHYLIGRRTVAVEQFEEAKRLVPGLVVEGFAEHIAPPRREQDLRTLYPGSSPPSEQEKDRNGSERTEG